jgi:hypothetical protein
MVESYPAELPGSESQQSARQRLICQQFAEADGLFAYQTGCYGADFKGGRSFGDTQQGSHSMPQRQKSKKV